LVELIGVRLQRTIIQIVRHHVVVAVGVASIALPVFVSVELVGVAHRRAVVHRVDEAVVVSIVVANVSYAITVRVVLIGIRRDGTVVLARAHAVLIAVVEGIGKTRIACVRQVISIRVIAVVAARASV
jgi:hypothetical protein